MNTVLICSPSNSLHGGVENIVKDLCNSLPSRGWEPTLALGKGSRFNDVEAYKKKYSDLPIIEVDGTRGTRVSRLKSLTDVIRRVQPQVVLSARIFDAYEAVSALKSHQKVPRLAVTIQAYEAPYFFDARLYRNNIDFCVTAGDLTRTVVTRWCGLPEERVASIPNGVNLPIVAAEPRRFSPPLRIGYVGRLDEEQKRISDLAPFLREVDGFAKEYTLDIIGTGPCESQLKQDLSMWVDRRQVRFHGWQNRDTLYNSFYPSLDCLIHFAHTEGVPLAPGEALMHGIVPVI
jgi:glycosyltransferase involved in cell wall biosynthesis